MEPCVATNNMVFPPNPKQKPSTFFRRSCSSNFGAPESIYSSIRLPSSNSFSSGPIQPPDKGFTNGGANVIGTSMYQVHDGFATVRKRKGPSCASIAMRQEQEFYDLALLVRNTNNPPKGVHNLAERTPRPLLSSFTAPNPNEKEPPISSSSSEKKRSSISDLRPADLSEYAKIPLKSTNQPFDFRRTTSPTHLWESPSSLIQEPSNGGAGEEEDPSTNLVLRQNNGRIRHGQEHRNSTGGIKASNSSLSRKLRRLVLPSKLFPPSSSKSDNYAPNPNSIEMGRLRNSVSDNSLANISSLGYASSNSSHSPPHSIASGNILYNSQPRHLHRSCLLHKAALDPVMEDGIPWRPRRDVPWYELATKKYRYRSCPVLQLSQQQAHVVAAFEQSLSNMTQRLQSLTASAEQKDSELTDLRNTIELLRKQSIEAGLTVSNITSSAKIRQLSSADSVSSINSISSACSGTSHSHSHTSSPSGVQMTPLGTPIHNNNAPESPNSKKKHSKNKGWLRSSFTKAFSRSKGKNAKNGSVSDLDGIEENLRRPLNLNGDIHHHNGQCQQKMIHVQCGGNTKSLRDSAPASPLLTSPHGLNSHGSSSSGSHSPRSNGNVKGSSSSSALCDDYEEEKTLEELKKQLREKEMVLTDIRLEALTSAHQLESLKETVNKMRNEMINLKQDNDRLQSMISCGNLSNSQNSSGGLMDLDRRLSTTDSHSSPGLGELLLSDTPDTDGKRIVVTLFLGSHGSFERFLSSEEGAASETLIATLFVSNKTNWEALDTLVKRAFRDYVMRIDPNLGINSDSIWGYNIGEIIRTKDEQIPDLLPYGYLVGDVNKIRICLKGATTNGSVDGLVYETLIPKPLIQRYLTLLSEHGRMIICGPSGTGKSFLARKLGEYLVARSGKDLTSESIATFSVDQKNTKELKQYLTNLAEHFETVSPNLPYVIILDNLHHAPSLEIFNGFLHASQQQSTTPIIIGTMTQSASSAPNLQIHHNSRWILVGNNTEPVKGLLSRYLKRRFIEADIQNSGVTGNMELIRVIDWIPKVWLHVNKFLEAHNSQDATIGPRLFLSCPMNVANSQVWFSDLWHYSIIPYLIEAVKEGLQLYGRKAPWEDPSQFIIQTYPWTESHSLKGKASIHRLRPEDVGYENKPTGSFLSNGKPEIPDPDPLMNMLMRLQEAANYKDSDSTSLDSHASSKA